MNSLKKVSSFISQLHVLKSFMEKYVLQLQEYSTSNMSLDSFLLQDEMLLELIEEFNGFQQRAHSERVLGMLECEMNILEIIEELYEWLVQYTKTICSNSQELGMGDVDYNGFIKSQLLKEQQRFNEKIKAEEKRLKKKSKKNVNVYEDESIILKKQNEYREIGFDYRKSNNHEGKYKNDKLDDYKSTWSPIQNDANQDRNSQNNIADKENSMYKNDNLSQKANYSQPSSLCASAFTLPCSPSFFAASPITTRTRRSLSKPMTPIQKVVSPPPPEYEARDSQIQHLRVQFRQFLIKEAFQAISRLNDFAPQLSDLDLQIKRHKSQLEQHLLDVKEWMKRHNDIVKHLEKHKYMFPSAEVERHHAIFEHWQQDELIF